MDDPGRTGPSLLQSLWRSRVVVAVITVIAGALGYAYALQQDPSYDASARLFLTDPGAVTALNERVSSLDVSTYVLQQAARASSQIVLEEAAARLDGVSPDELQDAVKVNGVIELLLLEITGTGSTPEEAAAITNALATAYLDTVEQDAIQQADDAVQAAQAQLAALEADLAMLNTQLEADPGNLALANQIRATTDRILQLEAAIQQRQLDARIRGDGVDFAEFAEPPLAPARPSPRLNALVFAMLGAAAAAMWAYWWAARTQRVTYRTDPQRVLGIPPLGEIPLYEDARQDDLARLVQPHPAVAEAYEFVLSSVEFALADSGGHALLITSALPGDGKTSTALQLAIAASRDGRKVMLVDGDIRARGLSRLLQAGERAGLVELASADLTPDEVARRYRFSEQSQVPVVTAGQRRDDASALLRTSGFRRALRDIRADVELLLVDSSPILAVADATIVAGSVDAIVLVVTHGTLVSELEKVRERLAFVPTPVLGYIYNRSQTASAGGYGYGLPEAPPRRWFTRRRRPPVAGPVEGSPATVAPSTAGQGRTP